MDSAWISAGAGLVGVLVGGLVSGGLTYRIERSRQSFEERRDRRERLRQARREQTLVRGIARYVDDDFRRVQVLVGYSMDRDEWWTAEMQQQFGHPISLEDRKLVAQHLSEKAWDTVSNAEAQILFIRVIWREDIAEATVGRKMGEPDKVMLKDAYEAIAEARVCLKDIAEADLIDLDPAE